MPALIFRIRVEAKARSGPMAGKWERTSWETSHWPSGQAILESYVRANPSHEVRLVAELIEASVDLMPAERPEND